MRYCARVLTINRLQFQFFQVWQAARQLYRAKWQMNIESYDEMHMFYSTNTFLLLFGIMGISTFNASWQWLWNCAWLGFILSPEAMLCWLRFVKSWEPNSFIILEDCISWFGWMQFQHSLLSKILGAVFAIHSTVAFSTRTTRNTHRRKLGADHDGSFSSRLGWITQCMSGRRDRRARVAPGLYQGTMTLIF